jgi:hypothetical protein
MRRIPALTCCAILSAAVAGVASFSSVAHAYPQPSLYPISWEIDFKYEEPKRIVVETPGGGLPKAYWYMTYVATNKTDKEQIFLPKFEMVTRDGRVFRSDVEASPAVFQAIARRERSRPIQPTLKLQGQILVGEDHAKYGVAIWQEPSPEQGSFSIFIAGLSGETAALTDGDGKPLTDKDGNAIVLRKTRQLDFTVRGDELYAGDPIVKTGDTWVMR